MKLKRANSKYITDRIVLIKEMLAKNPHVTLQEMGNEFGITRQGIDQFLKRHGIDKLRKKKTSVCPEGHEYPEAQMKATWKGQKRRCVICKPIDYGKYMDKDGYIQLTMITKPCHQCNNPVTRSIATAIRLMNNSKYTNGYWFCNKKCFQSSHKLSKWWLSSPVHQNNYKIERAMERKIKKSIGGASYEK